MLQAKQINEQYQDLINSEDKPVRTNATELLEILEDEKEKRGMFQYHRLSRNNF